MLKNNFMKNFAFYFRNPQLIYFYIFKLSFIYFYVKFQVRMATIFRTFLVKQVVHPFLCSFSYRKTLFFLLTPSPWPIFASISAFVMLYGFVGYLNFYVGGLFVLKFGFILLFFAFISWCYDLILELTFLGNFSKLTKLNIKWGFWLFIVSEALLFVSFFWSFFHSSLEPAIQLGSLWPPLESIQMNNVYIPTANTAFLLLSGAAVTWMQYAIIAGMFLEVLGGFFFTFIFAFLFLISQWKEYCVAFHQINDSVFGSTMYVLTGFHGAHVFIGTVFLFVCFVRFLAGHFKTTNFLAVTLAAWYWHFVDVVWIFVYGWVYLWGTWVSETADVAFEHNFYNI